MTVGKEILVFTRESKLIMRGSALEKVEKIVETSVPVDKLSKELQILHDQIHEIVEFEDQKSRSFRLEEVEISAEISAEGSIGLLGTGTMVGGKGSITFKLRRKT